MDKTVEQLREEVAKRIFQFWFTSGLIHWEDLIPENKERVLKEADKILSIFLDQTKDDCPECGGTGWKLDVWEMHGLPHPQRKGCSTCQGTGKDPNSDWHPERLKVVNNGKETRTKDRPI